MDGSRERQQEIDRELNATLAREITTYHAPSDEMLGHIAEVRARSAALIEAILNHCPKSADRTASIRKVREAMMTANASIVLNGQSIG